MNHTLSVIVEDRPGVLARVAAMFSNRGFNIHSVTVSPTHVEGRSRITLVADAPDLEQLQKQLHKLINVIKVQEYDSSTAIESEVALVRVACDPATRGIVTDTAALFGAHTVDVGPESMTLEVSGNPEHLHSFLDNMKPFGILDLVKSGRIVIGRVSAMRPSAAARAQR